MNAIIIDDEQNSAELLATLLKRFTPDVQIKGIANSVDDGLKLISASDPDVVFLDVMLPGKGGFDLLAEIEQPDFEVVFTTAHDNFTLKALHVHAFDYLLKPLDKQELIDCVERLELKRKSGMIRKMGSQLHQLLQTMQKPDRIAIHSADRITIILLKDIISLEATGSYTSFNIKNEDKIVSSVNLKEYEELLTKQHFCRVHHSYIINLLEVKRYYKGDGGLIEMSDKTRLPLSKRRKEIFLQQLSAATS